MTVAKKEFSLGIFVILGLLCIAYLTVKLGRLDFFDTSSYRISARFSSVTGLRSGANVEVAGVKVGRVGTIELDPQTGMAIVELYVDKSLALSNDTMASVKTAGLIGDKYVGLTLGGSDKNLQPNAMITDTESSTDIEFLISKYIFGGV